MVKGYFVTLFSRKISLMMVVAAPQEYGLFYEEFKRQGSSTVRARPGRLSALSVSPSKSVLYGAFVWARRALNS